MQCPVCHLRNPDSALRCDCGFDFVANTVKESYFEADRRRRIPDPVEFVRDLGRRDIRIGTLCLVCGAVATGGTYALALRFGYYSITIGALVYGLLWLLRGIDRVRTGIDRPFWGGPPS